MSRRWILYVEDNEDDLRLVREILPIAEFPVTWAASGADAWRFLADVRFDLLLLDHGLPDTNGLLLLDEIRLSHPHLPVVIITGREDEALAASAMAKGAAGYLCKDEISSRLAPTIERVLASVRASSPLPDGAESAEHLLRLGRLSLVLLSTLDEGVLLADAEGVVTFANEAVGRMLGEPPTSLLGRSAADLFDPATRARFEAAHRAFVERTPSTCVRFEGRLRENTPVYVSARSVIEELGKSEACLVALTDISDLALARNSLRTRLLESERFQRFFVDREQRIVELKAKIRDYERRLGILSAGLSEETRREIERRIHAAQAAAS